MAFFCEILKNRYFYLYGIQSNGLLLRNNLSQPMEKNSMQPWNNNLPPVVRKIGLAVLVVLILSYYFLVFEFLNN